MEFPALLLANASGVPKEPLVIGLLVIATCLLGVLFVVGLVMAITRKSKPWTIVCIAAGLLGGGCVVGTGVAMARLITERDAQAKTGGGPKQRLFSSDKSYSIEVPKAWKDTPKLHAEAGIASTDTFERTCVMVLADPKADFAGTLESFDELTVGSMKGALEGAQASEPEGRMIGGFRAIESRLTGRAENLNIVYHRVSIETADAYYQIIAWTTPSREKLEIPTFKRIFDSFEATAGPAAEMPGVSTGIGTRAVHIISEVLGMEAESITHESRIVADLGADDLDTVEIVMAIEEEFGVEVSDEQAEKLVSVGDLIRWLEEKAEK